MEMNKIVQIALYTIPLALLWWLFHTLGNILKYLKLIYEILKEKEDKGS